MSSKYLQVVFDHIKLYQTQTIVKDKGENVNLDKLDN